MSNPMIVMKDVSKSYNLGSESIQVLRDVDLTIPSGESVAVVGVSGCGKSTLLNLLGGLDKADTGKISACGYPVSDLSERGLTAYRSKSIGFVFQFHYLLKDFTSVENVMLPMLMRGVSRSMAQKEALKLLERVLVEERANHYPSQLSGGERQRVALARALINNPDVILADEPTGNLDEKHKNLVADIFFRIVSEEKKTLILVTHAADLAARADKTFLLTEGQLARN